MAWIISKALAEACGSLPYLQAQEAESSAANSSAGKRSAQSKSNPTPQAFSSLAKTKEFLRLSRSGMTYAHSTEAAGEAVLMSYLACSLARTLAPQEKAQESAGRVADSGAKCSASFARYDRDLCSWRTPQLSLVEGLDEFSENWPRQGMMRSGWCYPLEIAVPRMSASGYGYSQRFPTPTKHNAKEGNYPAESERNTPTLASVAGGKLNPQWTEWLMGWPTDWSGLRQLGTAKFRSAWLAHFKFCQETNNEK